MPLSAVRYTVKIAKNDKNDERNTQKLIKEIADWLGNHSAKSKRQLIGQITIHITFPYLFLIFLAKIGFKNYAGKKVAYWMAFDIYPEYAKEASNIVDFINETITASQKVFD
ncbi:MAG: hypothetical protein QXG67_02640 [Candidatus Nitrosotenuis sp.]